MNVESMYDNVGHELYGNAWTPGNVYARTPTVDCFERVHYQFFFQLDGHVTGENDRSIYTTFTMLELNGVDLFG